MFFLCSLPTFSDDSVAFTITTNHPLHLAQSTTSTHTQHRNLCTTPTVATHPTTHPSFFLLWPSFWLQKELGLNCRSPSLQDCKSLPLATILTPQGVFVSFDYEGKRRKQKGFEEYNRFTVTLRIPSLHFLSFQNKTYKNNLKKQ